MFVIAHRKHTRSLPHTKRNYENNNIKKTETNERKREREWLSSRNVLHMYVESFPYTVRP